MTWLKGTVSVDHPDPVFTKYPLVFFSHSQCLTVWTEILGCQQTPDVLQSINFWHAGHLSWLGTTILPYGTPILALGTPNLSWGHLSLARHLFCGHGTMLNGNNNNIQAFPARRSLFTRDACLKLHTDIGIM